MGKIYIQKLQLKYTYALNKYSTKLYLTLHYLYLYLIIISVFVSDILLKYPVNAANNDPD